VVKFIILRLRFLYENAFFAKIRLPKPKPVCQSQNVAREKLRKALSYKNTQVKS